MRGVILPIAFVLGLTLTGCMQAPEDNCTAANRDITFGNLLNNSVYGRYDACLNDLQRELDALRLEANVLQAKAQGLNAEAARLSGEPQIKARRLAHMNAEQAQLMRRLSSVSEDLLEANELRAVLDEEKALREQLQNVAAKIAETKRRQEDSSRRIRRLRNVSPSSTDAENSAEMKRRQEDTSRRIRRLQNVSPSSTEAELAEMKRRQEDTSRRIRRLQNVSPSSTDAELAELERRQEDISRRILRLMGR